MSSPRHVSVIIPTRDSVGILRRALESLTPGTQGDVSFEVVIVDQESSDGTVDVARSFGATVVETERPSLYAPPTRSRNLGAAAAQGRFLLHLDADMTLTPGLLARAVTGVGEHVALTLEEVDVVDGFWAECKALERATYRGSSVLEGARFVRAEVFHEVGGYDETLASGEDWDIHARYARVGTIGRVSEALRHHLGSISYRDQVHKKFLYGQSSASFLEKHDSSQYTRAMARAYLDAWPSLVRRPVHAAGMVALRAGEMGAVATGLLVARRRARAL